MAYRTYSDEERAQALAVLAANGGDAKKTSADTGIPYRTLRHWAVGNVNLSVANLCTVKKADLADRLEEIAHKLVDAMPGKIKEAPLKEIAVSLGIAVEKSRLLREKPTAITQQNAVTEDERRRRTLELLERGESRAGAVWADGRGTGGTGLDSYEQPAVH